VNSSGSAEEIKANLGTRRLPPLPGAQFPDMTATAQMAPTIQAAPHGVDVLFVNPPTPDGGIWIRCQHRVGRRSRENMIWPQVSLAQLAALLAPEHRVAIVDANATRMGWAEFEEIVEEYHPRYYVTQVTGPTLRNDMHGVFVARSLGARTIAFGTHVTPMTWETMEAFPALDFILRGEPELTLQELLHTLESPAEMDDPVTLSGVAGLAWRDGGQTVINADRDFIPDIDDLPMPLHELLPLDRQRMPLMQGPFSFVVTSRGCPAGCRFCIKHLTYQTSVRLRSPEKIFAELQRLSELGVHNIHMYADLFTVSRDQVVELCRLIIDSGLHLREGSRPPLRWMCNSRVDYVDQEMLSLMAEAGCWLIAWGIESANEGILKRAHKGYKKGRDSQALLWARQAGIKNWGYFIIGLPGETEETVQETIAYSKSLPLDIALFHIAAPHPGTPFFREVIENGWFRPDTKWEEVDMDKSTVLDYPNLPAERLEYWQKRATREWSLRPGPIWTIVKGLNSWEGMKSAVNVGLQMLGFVRA